VQIVDAAFAEAARKSGSWLLCRPGCRQCCIGAFGINQLDAARLRQGMTDLEAHSPERAAAVRERARRSIQSMAAEFPGDPQTGVLYEDKESKKRFEDFANDEPCPALDLPTGRCELYESRPMTCHVFGPPVRSEQGLGVCELCFQGATADEIAACEMQPDPDDLESTFGEGSREDRRQERSDDCGLLSGVLSQFLDWPLAVRDSRNQRPGLSARQLGVLGLKSVGAVPRIRLNPQDVEMVSAWGVEPDGAGFAIPVQASGGDLIGNQTIEASGSAHARPDSRDTTPTARRWAIPPDRDSLRRERSAAAAPVCSVR
jgi:Fe-S-cluster containining protein